MAFKVFTIPVRDDGSAGAELNAFLCTHRVLAIDRRWVDQGPDSFWSFCVDYFDGTGSVSAENIVRNRGKDYREVLAPEQFVVFAKLRDLRKAIAQEEGVPVYTIFTNEQLAQMVQNDARSKSDLAKVAGVGEARVNKYGTRFLDLLSAQTARDGDEADKPSI